MPVLAVHPWTAAVVAAVCLALWRWRGGPVAGAAAAAWLLYAGYEYLMYLRVLCSGECNIRVDLLLLHPLLVLLTLAALITSFRPRTRRT